MTDNEILDILRKTLMKGASEDELRMFLAQAQRTGLDPLARQIYAMWRVDRRGGGRVMQVVVSIDGLRALADRTGKYAGQLGPFWCGQDGQWVDVWLSHEPPRAAKVGILRSDFKEALWGTAVWEAYAPIVGGRLSPMWQKMGAHMLAKCAEALGLRRAFPLDMSGLYTAEEMEQAELVPDAGLPASVEDEAPAPAPAPAPARQQSEAADDAEQSEASGVLVEDEQADPRAPFKIPEGANGFGKSHWRSGPGAKLIPQLRRATGLSAPELLEILEDLGLSIDMGLDKIVEAVMQERSE